MGQRFGLVRLVKAAATASGLTMGALLAYYLAGGDQLPVLIALYFVASGFMGEWQMGLLHASADAEALLRTLVQSAGPDHTPVPLRDVI